MNVHSVAQMDGETSGDTSDGSTAREPTSRPSETHKNGSAAVVTSVATDLALTV